MSRRRHTPEQMITALREAEVGLANSKTVGMVSRELGISEQTYYRWRQEVSPELLRSHAARSRGFVRGGVGTDVEACPSWRRGVCVAMHSENASGYLACSPAKSERGKYSFGNLATTV